MSVIEKLRAVIANATSACVPGEGYCLACEGQHKLRMMADPTTADLFVNLLEAAGEYALSADRTARLNQCKAIAAIHKRLEGKL